MNKYKWKNVDGSGRLARRLKWAKHRGETPVGYYIHHVNGDKADNRLAKLKCIPLAEHSKLHSTKNRVCEVQDCHRKYCGNGMCEYHYNWSEARRTYMREYGKRWWIEHRESAKHYKRHAKLKREIQLD